MDSPTLPALGMEPGQQKSYRSWPAVKDGTGPVKKIQHMAINKGWNRASRKDTEPVSSKDGTWPAKEIQNLASSKLCNLAS
jgi:hypothetical protein